MAIEVRHLNKVFETGRRQSLRRVEAVKWFELTPRQSYRMLAAIYGLDREREHARVADLAELAELFDAVDLLDTPVRGRSLGQRMRCELAACMLHEPEMLFLDEPTIGLDLLAKQRFRDLLVRLNTERRTTRARSGPAPDRRRLSPRPGRTRRLARFATVTIIVVMSETLPLAEIKAHLSEVVDRVERQHERVILTRNGRPAAVIMSPADLEALEDTLDLVSDPTAMKEIQAGRADVAGGRVTTGQELRAKYLNR